MKKNCWEFMKCGRQEGGDDVEKHGVCPAYEETRLDGIHDGKNAGRTCWLVSGTLCKDKVQGTFAQKQETCTKCKFYKYVEEEEKRGFHIALELIHLLKD